MAGILTSLSRTIVTGFILAALLLAMFMSMGGEWDMAFWTFFMRWLHVLCGVMWIGILWYFNFIQIPNMGNIPDDQKPAISKVIAPEGDVLCCLSALVFHKPKRMPLVLGSLK